MAIGIRCAKCRKRVSLDEAFAGEVCRCPYCRELIHVMAGPKGMVGRPVAPTNAGTAGPAGPAGGRLAEADDGEHVPMANPVRLQGIITIVLLVLMLGMIATGAVIAVKMAGGDRDRGGGGGEGGGGDYNPFQAVTPGNAGGKGSKGGGSQQTAPKGFQLRSPIVYCIDGGSSMRDTLDYAVLMVRVSVQSLTPEEKFTVLLSREDGEKEMPGGFQDAGQAGAKAALDFLTPFSASGASDIPRALAAALAKKPGTIVLYARKDVDDAADVANQAKAQGVRIMTVALTGEEGVVKSMAKLAEITGGQSQSYTLPALYDWVGQAPPLD